MNKTLGGHMHKHYLACLCKGTSIFSWKTIELPSRDTNIAKFIIPNTYAYFFFDTELSTDIASLTPRQILNTSPVTYLGGTIYTLDDVKRMVRNEKKKISITPLPGTSIKKIPQMTQIINTSSGNWIPFFEGDILINV